MFGMTAPSLSDRLWESTRYVIGWAFRRMFCSPTRAHAILWTNETVRECHARDLKREVFAAWWGKCFGESEYYFQGEVHIWPLFNVWNGERRGW